MAGVEIIITEWTWVVSLYQKILMNESLEYKGLMLIPMAGVFVSRLSLYSFEELWRPEMP